MVIGEHPWEEWKKQTGWQDPSGYAPPEAVVAEIARLAREKGASFTVVGASWCPDTRSGLPLIVRLLALAGVPEGRVRLIGVDRNLADPAGVAASLGIERVPTLVVTVAGREAGRIVEHPAKTWEADLLAILSAA